MKKQQIERGKSNGTKIIWGAGSVFNQNMFEIRRMLQNGVNIIALVDQGKKAALWMDTR